MTAPDTARLIVALGLLLALSALTVSIVQRVLA